RDKLVTGVQTCALPISPQRIVAAEADEGVIAEGASQVIGPLRAAQPVVVVAAAESFDVDKGARPAAAAGDRIGAGGDVEDDGSRSEERRVGEGWRVVAW